MRPWPGLRRLRCQRRKTRLWMDRIGHNRAVRFWIADACGRTRLSFPVVGETCCLTV
jgi:hypothetical protein